MLAIPIYLIAATFNATVPFYVLAPGSMDNVAPLVNVPEERGFADDGDIFLATVGVQEATVFEVVRAWFTDDTDVMSEEQLLGTVPASKFEEQNEKLFRESQLTAMVVALRRLGHQVGEHGKGALVLGVDPEGPSAKLLKPGDTVTAINGRPIQLATDLTLLIGKTAPGSEVTLQISRPADAKAKFDRTESPGECSARGKTPKISSTAQVPDKVLTKEINVGVHPMRKGAGYVGVSIFSEDLCYDFPFSVSIANQDIGGPSAGLAFTLAVIDALTPGDLTGGEQVAATGTIEVDGTVGDVGGVRQKTKAVRKEGATVFLVPPGEFAEAKARGQGLKVIKVTSLEEALKALESLGGDTSAVPQPPPQLRAIG